jgi:hypothetical protein
MRTLHLLKTPDILCANDKCRASVIISVMSKKPGWGVLSTAAARVRVKIVLPITQPPLPAAPPSEPPLCNQEIFSEK